MKKIESATYGGKGWWATGRRIPVEFSSTIEGGQSVEITLYPAGGSEGENAVRSSRLWVNPARASSFMIEAFRVGIVARKMPMQGDLFTMPDGQIFESFEICPPGTDVGLTVHNVRDARSRFEAIIFFELLEPYRG